MRTLLPVLLALSLSAGTASSQECNPLVAAPLPVLPDAQRSWWELAPAFTDAGELWLLGTASPPTVGGPATVVLAREQAGGWLVEDSLVPATSQTQVQFVLGDGPTAMALLRDGIGQYRVARRDAAGTWDEFPVVAPAATPSITDADIVAGPGGSHELVLVAHDGSGGANTLWVGIAPAFGSAPLPGGMRLSSLDAVHRLPDGRILVAMSRAGQLHAALVDGPAIEVQMVASAPNGFDGYWALAAHEPDGRPRVLYQFQSGRGLELNHDGSSWAISRAHPPLSTSFQRGSVRADGELALLGWGTVPLGPSFDQLIVVLGGRMGDNPMPASPRRRELALDPDGGLVAIAWSADDPSGAPSALHWLHPDYWQQPPPVPTVGFSREDPVLNVPFTMDWSAPRSLARSTGLVPLHRCQEGSEELALSADQSWQAWAGNLAGTTEGPVQFLDLLSFELRNFSLLPQLVAPGELVQLAWTVWGSAQVSIDGFGPQPLSGTLRDYPLQSRDYNLRIQGSEGGPEEVHSLHVQVFEPGEPQFRLSWDGVGLPGLPPRVEDGIPFDIHLFATGVPDGIEAWELELLLPPGLLLIDSQLEGDSPINVANGTNFVVGTGNCLDASLLHRLATFTLLAPDAEPLAGEWIGLGPPTPSSFPTSPGYSNCDAMLVALPVGPGLELREGTVPVLDLGLAGGSADDGRWLGWSLPAGLQELRLEALDSFGGGTTLARWSAAPWPTRWSGRVGAERFRLTATLAGGSLVADEISLSGARELPSRVAIPRVWPNPANPRVQIELALPRAALAQVRIVDLAGRRVRVLLQGELPAGATTLVWDGSDDRGAAVASGSYFVELQAAGRVARSSLRLVR